ncbi:MAG: hypothetical protein E6729_04980, partial [Finegoldia magna]|nr:hypothetical protein [Finegoldia magna]
MGYKYTETVQSGDWKAEKHVPVIHIDKKEGFTADDLSRIFKETLQKFWGEDVEINEGSEL